MGGYGSGWQGAKKVTVEDCLVLAMTTLVRKQALVPGALTRGRWGWWRQGETSPFASLGYEADLRNHADAWLRLRYRANDEPVDHRIRLTTTQPTYGGRRWWFIYPLGRPDDGPGHRVAKLHLPPGSRYFGSRIGHGLTYTSCQRSGEFRGLFRHLAAELGLDERSVRTALTRRKRA